MPPIATNIILYTSIAAFVLCVIGGLLILFERWEPKHTGTRRWLVGGVLASIVGGVVGNSNAMFNQSGKAISLVGNNIQGNPANANAAAITPSATAELNPPNPDQNRPSDDDVPQPDTAGLNSLDSTPPITPARAWSPQILSWQSENLPTRPTLPTPPDKSFPKCAEEMKAQDITEITKESARSCFRLLDQFNSNILLPYQVHYHPYTDQVERAARNQPDAQILDFLQLEYFNLTDSEGADFLRFNEISNKFDGNRRWVQRLK